MRLFLVDVPEGPTPFHGMMVPERAPMETYPIMLDLHGRLAVVVGAGAVGLRKVGALRRAEAQVRLVAPQIDTDADLAGLDVVRRAYHEDVLTGAFLVLACTNDRGLNARIARDARRIGALVNVADTPEECDFHLPATVRDGDVTVAIGTGGAAPAVSAWLRRRIAHELPERLGPFAAALDEVRTELKAVVADPERRMAIVKQLASDEGHREFLRAGRSGLREKLSELMEDKKET